MHNCQRDLSAYILSVGKSQSEIQEMFAQLDAREINPMIAAESLGLDRVSATLDLLALYLPKVLGAAAILLIGEAVAKVPGVKTGIAMAATLTCIQENTGLTTEVLRRALPAANEPICSLNATQLGKLLSRSAKATNQLLASGGLQFRNDRDEWELTEAGEAWAESMPYSRNGHSGYQILWNPAVAEQLKEVA